MKEDFSVPQKYKELQDKIYAKEKITKRDFIDLSLLAVELVDKHWDKRQGLAYHIVGMLANPLIQKDRLLDDIACLFGILELPDRQIADTNSGVRNEWEKVKKLVHEADKKYR